MKSMGRRRLIRIVRIPVRFEALRPAVIVKRISLVVSGVVPIFLCLFLLTTTGRSARTMRKLTALGLGR